MTPNSWIIKDWAGNLCLFGKEFESFDDAEEFLCETLDDNYTEDRQEYEITPNNGWREARYLGFRPVLRRIAL